MYDGNKTKIIYNGRGDDTYNANNYAYRSGSIKQYTTTNNNNNNNNRNYYSRHETNNSHHLKTIQNEQYTKKNNYNNEDNSNNSRNNIINIDNSRYYDQRLNKDYQLPKSDSRSLSLPGHSKTGQAGAALQTSRRKDKKELPMKVTTKKPTTKKMTTKKPTTTHKSTTRKPTTHKPMTTKKMPAMPLVENSKLKGYGRMKDECSEYYKASRMQRTVHLHVLGKDDFVNDNDITLVTQMTSERYDKLYNLAMRWSGPISVSVYVEKATSVFWYTRKIQSLLAPRKNIALHLVGEEGPFFPVNFLRNIALENAETKYVFLSDIDFEPMPGLDIHLQDYISKGYLQGKTALVVAVFEALTENIKFPKNKVDLLKLWKKDKTIRPFHFRTDSGKEEATATQAQTDYPRWATATKPYYVDWAEYFEPYVVVEKALSCKYWPEYVGRFFNKESQLAELFAMGFNFIVLPDVFTLHTPHLPKPGSDLEQRCGKRVNARFKIYLMDKYGWKMPVKIFYP